MSTPKAMSYLGLARRIGLTQCRVASKAILRSRAITRTNAASRNFASTSLRKAENAGVQRSALPSPPKAAITGLSADDVQNFLIPLNERHWDSRLCTYKQTPDGKHVAAPQLRKYLRFVDAESKQQFLAGLKKLVEAESKQPNVLISPLGLLLSLHTDAVAPKAVASITHSDVRFAVLAEDLYSNIVPDTSIFPEVQPLPRPGPATDYKVLFSVPKNVPEPETTPQADFTALPLPGISSVTPPTLVLGAQEGPTFLKMLYKRAWFMKRKNKLVPSKDVSLPISSLRKTLQFPSYSAALDAAQKLAVPFGAVRSDGVVEISVGNTAIYIIVRPNLDDKVLGITYGMLRLVIEVENTLASEYESVSARIPPASRQNTRIWPRRK